MSGRERAYEFLKRHVLSDPDLQGQFINEQDLADRIGVSRTPIREALLMLAAEELVQLVPKRGAYIAPMSGRDLAELIESRGVIERFTARRALERGTVPLPELREVLDQQRRVRDASHATEFIELDTRFHTTLVQAAGNQVLTRMYAGLRDRQVRAGLVALYQSTGRQDSVLGEHDEIVAALANGDAEAAAAAIDRHLETTLSVQLTN